jgi:bisphosphoglycerate-dependent phosphoglycerate mutase family 1
VGLFFTTCSCVIVVLGVWDDRYAKLSPEQLESSRAESLKDTADRIMPFYNALIVPTLLAGNKCIIVSHANTIRTLIKQIDRISDEDIKGMSIPTGIPLLYRLDKNLRPVDPVRELEFRYLVEPKGYVGCRFALLGMRVCSFVGSNTGTSRVY